MSYECLQSVLASSNRVCKHDSRGGGGLSLKIYPKSQMLTVSVQSAYAGSLVTAHRSHWRWRRRWPAAAWWRPARPLPPDSVCYPRRRPRAVPSGLGGDRAAGQPTPCNINMPRTPLERAPRSTPQAIAQGHSNSAQLRIQGEGIPAALCLFYRKRLIQVIHIY